MQETPGQLSRNGCALRLGAEPRPWPWLGLVWVGPCRPPGPPLEAFQGHGLLERMVTLQGQLSPVLPTAQLLLGAVGRALQSPASPRTAPGRQGMSQLGCLLSMDFCARLSITCLPSNTATHTTGFLPQAESPSKWETLSGGLGVILSSSSAARMDHHQNHVEKRKGGVSLDPLRAGLSLCNLSSRDG